MNIIVHDIIKEGYNKNKKCLIFTCPRRGSEGGFVFNTTEEHVM